MLIQISKTLHDAKPDHHAGGEFQKAFHGYNPPNWFSTRRINAAGIS